MSVTPSGSAASSDAMEGASAKRGLWSSRLAFILAASGQLAGQSAEAIGAIFSGLLSDPMTLLL